jgi:ATP-binding cassette subfamily C protein
MSRALAKDVWSAVGWKLPLLIALTLASAFLEGATVASLLPLLASFSGAHSASADRVTSMFGSWFDVFGFSVTPLSMAGLVVFLIILSSVVFLLQAHLAARLHAAYVASWQRRMFSAFLAADYDFFVSRRAGDLVAAITNEPSRIGLVFSQVSLILAALFFIAVQIVVSLFVAPVVVGLLVGFGALLFLLTRWWALRATDFGSDLTKVNAELLADTSEIVRGVKFVKATATEERALQRLVFTSDRMEALFFGNAFDAQLVRAIFEYSGGLLIVALLVLGPTLLSVDVGAILVIVAIFVRLFPRVTGLRQNLQIADFHMPAFRAAMQLVQDAESKREPVLSEGPDLGRAGVPVSIVFDDVSVALGGRTVLDRVNVEIPPGAFVALAGHTGAGKTTFLDCILGLRLPTQGSVKINGHTLDSLSTAAWRRRIGYLGQDSVLFNTSIRENLSWIYPHASSEEMHSSLDRAAADFVSRLPDGLDTVVGDHGSKLSGGERQRIALARALLGAPELLVLDEATSALDSETEKAVVAALSKLKGRMTIVAISHRPALIDEADFVINLNAGKVVQVASPLLQKATK